MKIHAEIQTPYARLLLVETLAPATGVYRIGQLVCLRIVRVPLGVTYKSARTKGAEQLEAKELSTVSCGGVSPYQLVLPRMRERLSSYALAA